MKKLGSLLIIGMMLLLVGCSQAGAEKAPEAEAAEVEAPIQVVENTEETEEMAAQTLIVEDALSRQVKFEIMPERVLSLYASFTDLWLEAGGTLVGTVDSSTLPAAAADIPKLGKGTPNVEDILTYEPDLVLLSAGRSAHQELADVFDQNGIQYLFIDYNNFEECLSTYQKFCQLTDRADLFESQGLMMQEEIKSIVADQEEKEFTYLLLFATSKSVTTKDDNIASEIINECGGINIAEDGAVANEESKQFSLEKILEMDPDYIFVQTMGTVEKAQARLESDILSNPAWNGLSAVQGDRYLYLPKELFLYKPNMKYPDAYQYLVDLIHE
jgi:iron complex transport system substrate-binding protein